MNFLQLSLFYKNLAEMNNAGLNYLSVFETLKNSKTSIHQQNKYNLIIQNLRQGTSLTESLRPADLLPIFDIPLIASGEKSGKISAVLEILAKNYQQSAQAEKIIRSGLFRPFFTLAAALMLPGLPALVSEKITVANYALNSLGILTTVILFSYFFYKLFMLSYFNISLARWRHSALSGLPVLRSLTKKMVLEKFISGLALMLESGLPIFEALAHVGKTSADVQISLASSRIIKNIRAGKSLSQSFNSEDIFTDEIKNSVLLGAESGKLPDFLKRSGEALKSQIFTGVENISKAIPVIIYWLVSIFVVYTIASSYTEHIEELNKALRSDQSTI